jgi:hypothetical protein
LIHFIILPFLPGRGGKETIGMLPAEGGQSFRRARSNWRVCPPGQTIRAGSHGTPAVQQGRISGDILQIQDQNDQADRLRVWR